MNFDIDAICACKILQNLLKNDNMVYTLMPVQGVEDLVHAYEENAKDVIECVYCQLWKILNHVIFMRIKTYVFRLDT